MAINIEPLDILTAAFEFIMGRGREENDLRYDLLLQGKNLTDAERLELKCLQLRAQLKDVIFNKLIEQKEFFAFGDVKPQCAMDWFSLYAKKRGMSTSIKNEPIRSSKGRH